MCQLPKEGVPSLSYCHCNPFSFSDLCALAQAVEWQQRARSWCVRAVAPAHPWACTPAHEHRNRAGDSECLPLLGYPHCLASHVDSAKKHDPWLRVCFPMDSTASQFKGQCWSAEQCGILGPLC